MEEFLNPKAKEEFKKTYGALALGVFIGFSIGIVSGVTIGVVLAGMVHLFLLIK